MLNTFKLPSLSNMHNMHVLSADIFAFQQTGSLTRLAKGTEFKVIGKGFNDRTVKALSRGIAYFIFLRDIDDSSDYPVSLYG